MTFEASPSILKAVRDWAPIYPQEASRAALAKLGVENPALAAALSDAYVASQRRGHPLVEGAAELVQFLRGRSRLALLTKVRLTSSGSSSTARDSRRRSGPSSSRARWGSASRAPTSSPLRCVRSAPRRSRR